MQHELDQQAAQTENGLVDNPYASIKDGRLKLSKDKADLETESVKQLRRIMESHLRKIRIERLLLEVNDLCGFTQHPTHLLHDSRIAVCAGRTPRQ